MREGERGGGLKGREEETEGGVIERGEERREKEEGSDKGEREKRADGGDSEEGRERIRERGRSERDETRIVRYSSLFCLPCFILRHYLKR